MAVSAFILVDVVGDHTKSTYKTITRIEGVKVVHNITGPHDLIVEAQGDTLELLNEQTLTRIRAVDGVTKTLTCFVIGT
jgi:DNA-binding Lrp family transcriptional regulator